MIQVQPPNIFRTYFSKLYSLVNIQGRRRRGGSGGMCPRTFKSGGAQVGLSPPTFGQTKCPNFAIFSYFVVIKCKIFSAHFARQVYLLNIFLA